MAENKDTSRMAEPRKGQAMEKHRGTGWMLEPWEGFGIFPPMQRFAEEMDRLFDDFGMLWPQRRGHGLLSRMFGREPEGKPISSWAPRVELLEKEGQLVIHADLPGMTKEDVKVEVTDDAVIIQGERKEEKKEENKGYHYNEVRYGSFYRSLPLPEGCDPSKATADFRNGVLEVTMPGPKHLEKKTRTIEVKGE
jgi:HSP20 family protein